MTLPRAGATTGSSPHVACTVWDSTHIAQIWICVNHPHRRMSHTLTEPTVSPFNGHFKLTQHRSACLLPSFCLGVWGGVCESKPCTNQHSTAFMTPRLFNVLGGRGSCSHPNKSTCRHAAWTCMVAFGFLSRSPTATPISWL